MRTWLWRGRGVGSAILTAIILAAWFGFMVFWIGQQVVDIKSTLDLRSSGVHATAVALSTRSATSTTDRSTDTDYYTTIEYTVNDQRYVEEINGSYAKGATVRIVYDPDRPAAVRQEGEIGIGSLIFDFVFIVFGLGALVFGTIIIRGWRSF